MVFYIECLDIRMCENESDVQKNKKFGHFLNLKH